MFGQGLGNTDLDYVYTFIYSFSLLYQPTPRSEAALISKESIIITFSHIKAKVAKFDIDVKQLNVNLGLSFEQSIVGLCSRCYMASFVEIHVGLLVPGRF